MADFSDRYNTPIPDDKMAGFLQWLESLSPNQRNRYDYDIQGAYLAGLNADGNIRNHFPDKYKKPNHPTFSTQSVYNGQDGYQGGRWFELGDDRWLFMPSQTNRDMAGSQQNLNNYFLQAEPGNMVSGGLTDMLRQFLGRGGIYSGL